MAAKKTAKKAAKKTAKKAPRKATKKTPARKTPRRTTAPRVKKHPASPRGGPKCKSCARLHSKRQHWSHAEGAVQEHSYKKARAPGRPAEGGRKKAKKKATVARKVILRKRELGLPRPERGERGGAVRFARGTTSARGAVRRARRARRAAG